MMSLYRRKILASMVVGENIIRNGVLQLKINMSGPGTYVSHIQFNKPLVNDALINWGDGVIETIPSGTTITGYERKTHTYASAGEYRVYMELSDVDEYAFNRPFDGHIPEYNVTDSLKALIAVEYLHLRNQVSANYMFEQCINLTSAIVDEDASYSAVGITDTCVYMFAGCVSLASVSVNLAIGDAEGMFAGCSSLSYMPVSLTNNINASNMYNGCALTEIDIPLITIQDDIRIGTFVNCNKLTTVNIGEVADGDMSSMFTECTSLTDVTIGNINTRSCISMFRNCTSLTDVTIGNIVNRSGYVITASDMFKDCTSLTNVTIGNFDTDDASYMFNYETHYSDYLKSVVLGDLSMCLNGNSMFTNNPSLTKVVIGNMPVCEDMSAMFNGSYQLSDVTMGDINSILYADGMFEGCESLTNSPITNLYNCESANGMFGGCVNLSSVMMVGTINISYADGMFAYCESINNVSLSGLPICESIESMFEGCLNLTTLSGMNMLGASISLVDCNMLTYDSVITLFNDMSYPISNNEIYLSMDTYNILSPSDLAIVENKGWVVLT